MHPRIQELVQFIDEQYNALRAAGEAVPRAVREVQPAPGRWSVAQVLDHVSRVNNMAAGLVARKLEEMRAGGAEQETATGSVVDGALLGKLNNRTVRRNAPEGALPAEDARYDDACDALEASYRRMRDTFTAADGLALGTIHAPHPALGPLDLYQWGVAIGAHQGRHAAQVRETAEELAGGGGS